MLALLLDELKPKITINEKLSGMGEQEGKFEIGRCVTEIQTEANPSAVAKHSCISASVLSLKVSLA